MDCGRHSDPMLSRSRTSRDHLLGAIAPGSYAVRAIAVLVLLMGATPTGLHAQTRFLEAPVKIRATSPIEPVSAESYEEQTPIPPRRSVRFARETQSPKVSAEVVERLAAKPNRREVEDQDDLVDFLGERSQEGRERDKRRASRKFGDRIKDLMDPRQVKDWLFSDHAYDHFASPISNPFLFEDPRALTEVRPIFIYQKIPGVQPNFQGGSVWFLGTRASLAFTERFSITLNKLGGVSVNPGGSSPLESDFGFAELWLGPKVTILRDPQFGSILSAGTIFQIPTGSKKTYQDTGSLSIVPYVSYGKTLTEFRQLGTFNGILNGGYSFSTNRERSDYFYVNAHLDFDLFNRQRFYPVAELNWFQYTTNGTTQSVSGEGRDLFNFGSQAKGANLLTGALGFRVKIIEAAQLGAVFELPLIGNRDLNQYRFTVDLIFRY